jgi:glycosyltransferase involved in cell wall biosynthesis
MLVKHLARMGHEIHVVTSKQADGASTQDNVLIYPVMNGWSYFYGGTLLKTVLAIEPDIIHLQYPTKGYGRGFAPSLLGMQLKSRRSPAPYIVTLHEFYHANALRKAAVMPLLSEASMVIFPSVQEKEALKKRFDSLKRIPKRVIPIGAVIPDNYEELKNRLEQNRDALLKKWGAPTDGVIVNYGFLQPHKGFETLIRAMTILRKSGYNCELWHVGRFDPHKRSYDRFLKFISNDGVLKGAVKFFGYLPFEEAAEIFTIARAGVFPFTDGYSDRRSSMITFSFFDAPLVTTQSTSGEVNDRIRSHATLVEPNRPKPLAEKLEEIIANDAVYANQKERATGFKDLYDWKMIAQKTVKAYIDLLEARPEGLPEEKSEEVHVRKNTE